MHVKLMYMYVKLRRGWGRRAGDKAEITLPKSGFISVHVYIREICYPSLPFPCETLYMYMYSAKKFFF